MFSCDRRWPVWGEVGGVPSDVTSKQMIICRAVTDVKCVPARRGRGPTDRFGHLVISRSSYLFDLLAYNRQFSLRPRRDENVKYNLRAIINGISTRL